MVTKTTKKKTVRKKATKKKTTKKKVGRPSKFDTADKDYMKFLFETGKTDKQVAEKIGVDERTITNWKKEHKEFFLSLKDWKEYADGQVEKTLLNKALGYTVEETKVFCTKTGEIKKETIDKHYAPDTTSIIFWLKNRQPDKWRDKQEIDLGNTDNKEFKFAFDLSEKPENRN